MLALVDKPGNRRKPLISGAFFIFLLQRLASLGRRRNMAGFFPAAIHACLTYDSENIQDPPRGLCL
jgi:hypothetical protein